MSGLHLDDYHAAVCQHLAEQLPWLESVESYPELDGKRKKIKTPCAFFSILEWERADSQPMNGQLALSLDCEVLAVLGTHDQQHQHSVRNAAMAIGLKVDNCRFGLAIEPALLLGASPDPFEPELDAFAVWSIRFRQVVEIGVDAYAPEGLTPSEVYIGIAPEIGSEHSNHYQPLSEANDGS